MRQLAHPLLRIMYVSKNYKASKTKTPDKEHNHLHAKFLFVLLLLFDGYTQRYAGNDTIYQQID